MVWGKLTRFVRSPRAAIASALALDLSVRVGDLRPTLGVLGDLLAPVVSISVGVLAAATLSTATTWLLFAVAFYHLAPRVYPGSIRETTERQGFRVVFAGGGTVIGLHFTRLPGSMPSAFVSLLGLGALVIIAFLIYLRSVSGWALRDPDGRAYALMESSRPRDIPMNYPPGRPELGTAKRAFTDGKFVVAVGVLFVYPVVVGSALAAALSFSYPLPDLLAAGYVLAAPLAERVGWSSPAPTDVEQRILAYAHVATRGPKEVSLVALAACGLFFACLPLGDLAGFVLRFGTLGRYPPASYPELWWNRIGAVVCIGLASGHLVWVWIRTLERLPAFSRHWRDDPDSPAPSVPRPPLSVLPGLAAFAAGIACGVINDYPVVELLSVGWPLAAAAPVIAFLAGRRGVGTHSVENEDHHVVSGLFANVFASLVGVDLRGSLNALEPLGSALFGATLQPILLVSAAGIVALAYFEDTARYLVDRL